MTISNKTYLTKQKVWNVGIRGNLYRWMSSYPGSRTQFVRINDCLSHCIICTSGVPQGSHLGPILFNIFINNLVTSTHFARCLIYADDVKLYSSIASDSDAMKLRDDLNALTIWSIENGLPINPSKCCLISFHRKNRCQVIGT